MCDPLFVQQGSLFILLLHALLPIKKAWRILFYPIEKQRKQMCPIRTHSNPACPAFFSETCVLVKCFPKFDTSGKTYKLSFCKYFSSLLTVVVKMFILMSGLSLIHI